MTQVGPLLRALLWIAAVHAAGLYLFTTGFFLTRFEVPDVSVCLEPPDAAAGRVSSPSHLRSRDPLSDASQDANGCWMPRQFRRVVLVVIDALRFDFVASGVSPQGSSSSFYLNHLPILNQTLTATPANALLLKFIADPPTMTMQRLKGLTTGSLPTFLDIKDNMASSAITEDNFIRQLQEAKRPMVFMGDDTWDALYPAQFTRKYSYDSFNVKDLHTVDRGVIDHLFPELRNQDWDLLIAHMLGVDHVGHTHGPSSPHMTEKLDEMNGVLTRLINDLPDDGETLLLVMGDHGMSADGNHGGASDDETGAALFAYSKKPIVDSAHSRRWASEVPQVDLVPTISLLLGLPIPFGNLGSVIPHFFTDTDSLVEALRLNVAQVRRYLLTYSSASKLPQSDYDHLERLYREITEELEIPSQRDGTALLVKQQAYLREALALGRSIWTQFDLVSMGWGILLLVLAQALVLKSILTTDASATQPLSAIALFAVGGGVCAVLLPSDLTWLPRPVISRALLLVSTAYSIYQLVATPSKTQISLSWRFDLRRVEAVAIVSFTVVLLHALALLSNSYIVAEDRAMNFLVATVGIFLMWKSRRAPQQQRAHASAAALVFLVASRLASAIDPPNIIISTASLTRTWLPLAAIVLVAGVRSSAITGKTTSQGPSYTVIVAAAACSAYWLLTPASSVLLRLWLPRSVFLLLLAAICQRMWLARAPLQPHFIADRGTLGALVLLAFSLVLGPSSPITIVCLALQHWSFAVVLHAVESTSTIATVASWMLLWATVGYQSFFATGHQNTFTSLQNAAGFVGFDDFRFYWAGALLGFNTFGNHAVAVVAALPFVATRWSSLRVAILSVVAYYALNTLVSTAFVALQRRHLMVWAIFAPKFIFDGSTLLVVELFALVTILLHNSDINPLK